jgi:hypothetical protein
VNTHTLVLLLIRPSRPSKWQILWNLRTTETQGTEIFCSSQADSVSYRNLNSGSSGCESFALNISFRYVEVPLKTDFAVINSETVNSLYMPSFIINLSDDRSTASSKTIPAHNAIESFLLQMRVSSSVPKVTLSNTSTFLTRSVQLIFSILLQHHISKLSRCVWSTARIVQVSAPYKATLQM